MPKKPKTSSPKESAGADLYRVMVNFKESDREALERAAEAEGMSVSQYIRWVILKRVRKRR